MIDNDLIRRGDALALCDGYPYVEGVRDALADLPAVTVGVRPLVWVDGECLGDPVYTAGGYTIDDDGDDADHDLRFLLTMPASGGLRFPTLEAAKVAAQADYEARILAALDLKPIDNTNR
jgi:hypothetical protein